jgi:hypothetical protein
VFGSAGLAGLLANVSSDAKAGFIWENRSGKIGLGKSVWGSLFGKNLKPSLKVQMPQ